MISIIPASSGADEFSSGSVADFFSATTIWLESSATDAAAGAADAGAAALAFGADSGATSFLRPSESCNGGVGRGGKSRGVREVRGQTENMRETNLKLWRARDTERWGIPANRQVKHDSIWDAHRDHPCSCPWFRFGTSNTRGVKEDCAMQLQFKCPRNVGARDDVGCASLDSGI